MNMKLSHVFFALFILVGSSSVAGWGWGWHFTNSSWLTRIQENNGNATTRRFEWTNDPVVNQEADQASEEVRTEWTEALATFDPFEELSKLEMFQLYGEWKAEAKEIVKNNPNNARFKLHNSCQPIVKFFNTFAKKNACHPQETNLFVDKLTQSLNGILAASELDLEQQWESSTADATDPNVRGRRKLGCCGSSCTGGYWCGYTCGCRRRRLQGSDEISLVEDTPEKMEALVNSVIQELLWQCESRLHNIAKYTSGIDETCRDTLMAAQCEVVINVWDAISLEVDGVDLLAAEMIKAKLTETRI